MLFLGLQEEHCYYQRAHFKPFVSADWLKRPRGIFR